MTETGSPKMLKAVLGLAIITTLVVLSPERDTTNTSGSLKAAADHPSMTDRASLSALAAQLAPELIGMRAGTAPQEGGSSQIATLAEPAVRQVTAGGLEQVRLIVIPPAPVPISMPPLRH